jgi:S1-C subfamily serine protease
MTFVDLVILAAAVIYAIGGYRNGAVVGFFSLAGFLGGASLGAQLARPLGSRLAGGQAQVPLAIVCVLVCALGLQFAAVWLAGRLRNRITWHSARALDSGVGAALGIVSVLVVSWMLAVVVQSSPYPTLNSAVRRSAVVGAVNSVMPGSVQNLYSNLREFIDRSGFPDVLGDLQASHIVDVGPPDPALLKSAGVTEARPSVVKVYSQAPSCDRQIEGSGFAYAPDRILTNAHVVAGATTVAVESGGNELAARVVLYDPERDLAVLAVSGLSAPSLSFASSQAVSGANAIVLGYPEDGPFDVRPARIRDLGSITGHDIYGKNTITRQIYSIRGLVRSVNSGGPLITPTGTVLGVVFATAVDSSDTGYVLSDREIAPDVMAGQSADARVSTGACSSG